MTPRPPPTPSPPRRSPRSATDQPTGETMERSSLDPTPDFNLDRDLRRTDARKFGWIIGSAIQDKNWIQLAYILGRLDENIGKDEERSYVEAQKQLREVACAVFDIYPKLADPPPLIADSADVVPINGD
jgi:hypothetical protein